MGEPSAGQLVRIGVGNDGASGELGGGTVVTKTTNAEGAVIVTFTKAEDAVGTLSVGASLFDQQDGQGLQIRGRGPDDDQVKRGRRPEPNPLPAGHP